MTEQGPILPDFFNEYHREICRHENISFRSRVRQIQISKQANTVYKYTLSIENVSINTVIFCEMPIDFDNVLFDEPQHEICGRTDRIFSIPPKIMSPPTLGNIFVTIK